ncbi:MAG TPA: Glu-tRNA(Gln) amidotransferase subunit GatD [Candidatus Bathyarchaeia archaeon]|nr:Glu-tRNA(Gln) amidotransferase subunit GatD [Candidatus Bathyarchaeia archaeon]
MATYELEGYRGEILLRLKRAKAKIGSIIRLTSKSGEVFEGTLIPRSECSDKTHVVLKMKNGYNIGISLDRTEKLEVIGEGEKPHFTKPSPQPTHTGLPKVAIISTGGTIASRVDYRTGAVQPALTAADLASVVPELSGIAEIDAHILFSEYSENIGPTHWKGMADEIARRLADGADGIVISHGTDTLHYTAAALSFALSNLPAPVLLVGAQRSSDRPSSDAASNLTGALGLAARADMANVCIAMHKDLSDHIIVAHRGTRVRKCHTSRRDAFKSINSNPLASYDLKTGKIELMNGITRRDKSRKLVLKSRFDPHACLIKFYPGFDPAILEAALSDGARGIVLEGTGLGHVSRELFDPLKKAVKKEVPVFMTSQTIWGRVDMNVYNTGRDLLSLGVTPLEDMIAETAVVKLMWVTAQTRSAKKIREMMLEPVAGETTSRTLVEAS